MKIRVLIADDHQIVRQGLKQLLETQPDIEVVGEAEDGRTTLKLTRELTPDVIVMDVSMPELNGIDASVRIHSEFPDIKIIALSMYGDARFVTNMIKAGAYGYLLKDCAFEELAQAIRKVMANKTYLSPEAANIIIKDYFAHGTDSGPTSSSGLSSREREILQLLAEGKRPKEIADLLYISPKTVDTHRQQIMHKLSFRSIAELTKYAIREGFTTLEG
jgi:DNA-binding NarL/FixJ family response regulator